MTDRPLIVDPPCAHAAAVTHAPAPNTPDGCEECLRTGARWVHLRLCAECGHVGCCDDSPNRHASAHATAEHPLIRSLEPGEDWCWCFTDEVAMRIPQITGQTRIPPSPML